MKRNRNSNFGDGVTGKGGVYECRDCGKRTRETGQSESGVELCAGCYEYAGWVNTHSDYDHDNHPEEDCPVCQQNRAQKIVSEAPVQRLPAAVEAECRDKLYDALAVLMKDEKLRKVIEVMDPQAHAQASDALVLEDMRRKTVK